MSKVMTALPLKELLVRIAGEYATEKSIFGIPAAAFVRDGGSPGFSVFGRDVSFPIGPAAGPHTQSSQNLIAAYLAGARVFELKTVQTMDSLDIAKPCIDARDEGYNTEWSTELSLDDAREEYLRAWIVINLLDAILGEGSHRFIFNMSVGYTLEGIRGERMDGFINALVSPESTPFWSRCLGELDGFIGTDAFARAFGPDAEARARTLLGSFPASPVHSVTLSTMHGCPPDEIERIARYLLLEKRLATYVKMNPTLLGFGTASEILRATGWAEVKPQEAVFDKDLKMADAVALVLRLRKVADNARLGFGLKLSNTLACVNERGALPGGEMYMSGRALYPLTARLAAELAMELGRKVPFSWSAGASERNVAALLGAGIGPITAATELLMPGGYLRLGAMDRAALTVLGTKLPAGPNARLLASLAEKALAAPEYRADFRRGRAAIAKELPPVDCFSAPCIEACPVHQDVPGYVRDAAAGRTDEAFARICATNPLPQITGVLCDHACQKVCARNDYEGPVRIREVKGACGRAALEAGTATATALKADHAASGFRAAAIGAGPASLGFAAELARHGARAVVFEKGLQAGGVVASVVPKFRIGEKFLATDVSAVEALGVEFRFCSGGPFDLSALKAEGYRAVFVGTGAHKARVLPLTGEGVRVMDALTFLKTLRTGSAKDFHDIRRVAVAGGGNTAIDAARAARRLLKAQTTLLYRRTRAEMPAEREEVEEAEAEGVVLRELSLPERLEQGKVIVRAMKLGSRDASGRRSPVPTEETNVLETDLLVAAVGEAPDAALLASLGIAVGRDGRPEVGPAGETSVPGVYIGGDAARGPCSIIRSAADGRLAARAALAAAGIAVADASREPPAADAPGVRERRAKRGFLAPSLRTGDPGFLAREGERCLSCDSACLRCAEVCPNRANVVLRVGEGFAQRLQILHLDDLCNGCGNCATFCPYTGQAGSPDAGGPAKASGKPYLEKPTFFRTAAAFAASPAPGFLLAGSGEGSMMTVRAGSFEKRIEGSALADVAKFRAVTAAWPADLRAVAAIAGTVVRSYSYLIGGEA